MATWEAKPSFHEPSIWSLKSPSSNADTAPNPLSKSLLDALNAPQRQLDGLQSDSSNLDGYRPSACLPPSNPIQRSNNKALNSTPMGPTGKVTKKRARASRKPPTTVLEADSSNFRAMVQQLTGIPALPFQARPHGLDILDLVRPASKPSFLRFEGFESQIPQMDPSSLLLRPQQHQLQSETGFSPQQLYKYIGTSSTDHSRQMSSVGDFLRTPLDELGLDQNGSAQREREQLSPPKISWDTSENAGILKYKLMGVRTEEDDAGEQDGSGNRMVHMVDSWLSQTEDSKH